MGYIYIDQFGLKFDKIFDLIAGITCLRYEIRDIKVNKVILTVFAH